MYDRFASKIRLSALDPSSTMAVQQSTDEPHKMNTLSTTCPHALVGLGRFELPISRPPAERSRPN